jgi:hypothetical protein
VEFLRYLHKRTLQRAQLARWSMQLFPAWTYAAAWLQETPTQHWLQKTPTHPQHATLSCMNVRSSLATENTHPDTVWSHLYEHTQQFGYGKHPPRHSLESSIWAYTAVWLRTTPTQTQFGVTCMNIHSSLAIAHCL